MAELERRDLAESQEIERYFNKCKIAFEAEMFFYAEEYACLICNYYFRRATYFYEYNFMGIIANIFKGLGNIKNAQILEDFTNANNNVTKIAGIKGLFPEIEPIMPRIIREKIMRINLDHKYFRDFEQNYIRLARIAKFTLGKTKLTKNKKIRALDLGASFGALSFIYQKNDVLVNAIDIENTEIEFKEAAEILGIKIDRFTIKKKTPLLKFPNKFNIITANQICFNGHKTKDLWDVDDWIFFLNDLNKNHLEKDGIVLLVFNYENIKNGDQIVQLGKKTLEDFFFPFLTNYFKWKVAFFNKSDIDKL
jgi:hypothetical protein